MVNIKKIIKEFILEKRLSEGFDTEKSPDLKYYAFDWDDNIVNMPTKIMLLTYDDEEVGMSTSDFAEYRSKIGKDPFDYNGETIVGYAAEPYKNFAVYGDNQFIIDAMLAEPGPSWEDFVECINGGSIFAIITARGHTPSILKEAVYNYIVTDHNGIDKETLIGNLKEFRKIADEEIESDQNMINEYLNLCKFYPVSYQNEEGAASPEQGKITALKEFIQYVKEMGEKLNKKVYLKNDVKNFFIPQIGFSDDDPKNIEKIKDFLDKEYEGKEKPVRTYLTKSGTKKEV